MEKNIKKNLESLLPKKFYSNTIWTLDMYKNDWVIRWLMYPDSIMWTYVDYTNTMSWNSNDLPSNQSHVDFKIVTELPSSIIRRVQRGESPELEFRRISDSDIKKILLCGDKYKFLFFVFYCVYRIPEFSLLIKDVCKDHSYFMELCDFYLKNFNMLDALSDHSQSYIYQIIINLAIDYVTESKKYIKVKYKNHT